MNRPIGVLIVDDSAVVRQVLTATLAAASGIRVLGSVADPIFAMTRMSQEWPDVIILDIEMPRMDGVTFLRKLMAERPTPVVICSTLTEKGADVTMQALSAGAVDIITKPKVNLKNFLLDSAETVIDVVKAAARARPAKIALTASSCPLDMGSYGKGMGQLSTGSQISGRYLAETTDRVVVMGTSTGGTQALEYIFTRLPRTAPAIVVVQHMPERFTAAFAKRLNNICQLTIKEAGNNDRALPGTVLIAPGGKHTLLQRSGAQYLVIVKDGPLVSRHCPSVDVLFKSCAQTAGLNAVGIIMTGMGDDGANGLKEMHDAGALTIAQDEASSIVYGMPQSAVRLGAVDASLSLEALPELIMEAPTRTRFLQKAALATA